MTSVKQTAPAPDRLWIADITYLPTEQDGFLFLAVILDVFSRRVVGWSMQNHLRAELVLAAREMAVGKRRPKAGLIHHSDHGWKSHLRVLWRAVCGGGDPPVDGNRRRLL
jgi:putative transposase